MNSDPSSSHVNAWNPVQDMTNLTWQIWLYIFEGVEDLNPDDPESFFNEDVPLESSALGEFKLWGGAPFQLVWPQCRADIEYCLKSYTCSRFYTPTWVGFQQLSIRTQPTRLGKFVRKLKCDQRESEFQEHTVWIRCFRVDAHSNCMPLWN